MVQILDRIPTSDFLAIHMEEKKWDHTSNCLLSFG